MPVVQTAVTSSEATTIDDVLHRLDEIVNWSIQNKNRTGYFATLYRQMTGAVQTGINNNRFTDGKRMEKLDVIFANRYLAAWEAYKNKRTCSNAWSYAFDTAANNNLIVLQHLLLGINTHINLDLAIAAAETAPGNNIYALQSDFEKINDVIADVSQHVQDALCQVWFPLRMINRITNKREEAVINFSIKSARQASWANAVALAQSTGQSRTNYINLIDNGVVTIAKRITTPGFYMSCLLRPVLMMEDKDVAGLIRLIKG